MIKSWFNKNLNNIIVGSFLVPIFLVAFVSISHVTTLYGLSNPFSWAIYLSIAVEVAALAALAGISAQFGRFIYIPFGIVTLIQFVGNFFYCYSYIDVNSKEFAEWVGMISGLMEPLGIDPTDVTSHRRVLAFLTGGLIPFISLTFAHMLIVYSNKIQENPEKLQESIIETQIEDAQEQTIKIEIEDDENPEMSDIDIDELSKIVGKLESEQDEEKINPSQDELDRLQEVLTNLENQSTVVSDGLKRLTYTKNA